MAEGVAPISFVAPEQVTPDTVQFIIRTSEIEAAAVSVIDGDSEDSPVSFWQRFINLFAK